MKRMNKKKISYIFEVLVKNLLSLKVACTMIDRTNRIHEKDIYLFTQKH